MQIKIPHNRAIQLLEERLKDLSDPMVDIVALKNRLQSDIENIFASRSEVLKVITLNTLHFNDPAKLESIKNTFRQTIQGWINYINDFHIINQEKIELSEEQYKEKYRELLEKWNALVPEYNQLADSYEKLHLDYDEALDEIKLLKKKFLEETRVQATIRILFLAASPVDKVRLRLDQEIRDIEERMRSAALRENFELKSVWAVTHNSLQQAMLDNQPNIVHFSGHGEMGGIELEDALGNSRLVDNNALGNLFKLFSDCVECVILNSCFSESQANQIAKYVPYVIGMRSSIPDKAAIAFSVSFYAALGAGKDYEFAYKMGIVGIELAGVKGGDIPILLTSQLEA